MTLSVKEASKQDAARRRRRRSVKGPVAASQDPLLVKMGVRSWNARRVPVGRRFARFAVLVRVCESARRDRDVDDDGGIEVAGVVAVGVIEVGEVDD